MENDKKSGITIKNWSVGDKPRERLALNGAAALSDSELLGIILTNGSRDRSAVDLARDVLRLGKDNLNELGRLSVNDFKKVKGIGEAKAIIISAVLELGRRRHASGSLQKTVVKSSAQIAEYLQVMLKDYNYEVFAVMFLNRANKIKHFEIVSRGGISGTIADPRIILKKALDEEATSIILSHNHPSGSLKPSVADELITAKIKSAASFFDIKVLDHIIVSDEGYFSFADQGMM